MKLVGATRRPDRHGLPELALGAPGAANGAGRVYFHTGDTLATWAAAATPGQATERAADRAPLNLRGVADDDALAPLSLGDLDGDGVPEIAAGSEPADRVYLFWSAR